MKVEINKYNEEIVVKVLGSVDVVTSKELEAEVQPLVDQTSKLVFDFEEVPYLSSAGLRLILSIKKQMNSKSGDMVIKNINSHVKDVLDISGFSGIITVE